MTERPERSDSKLNLDRRVEYRTAELTRALAFAKAKNRELDSVVRMRDARQRELEAELDTSQPLIDAASDAHLTKPAGETEIHGLLQAAARNVRRQY